MLDAVHRRFASREVLAGLSLTVPVGTLQLVVGANGSGKSTLARLAVGLLRPTAGSVRIGESDPRTVPAARRRVGFVGHQSLLYSDLSAVENLAFTARLYGLDRPLERAAQILDRLDMGSDRTVAVRHLSRGLQQRVSLGRALLIGPLVLVFDEPFTGLDAPSTDRLLTILEETRQAGAAVLLVSHELGDVWRLEAQVAVLHGGRVAHATDTSQPLEAFRADYRAVLRG